MKHNVIIRGIAGLLVGMFLTPAAAFASETVQTEEKRLSIATMDSRPLSNDRLIYTALSDIDYQTTFTYVTAQVGYELANNGERDGVISSVPNMEELYPNLKKVPVLLERNEVLVFARKGSGLKINTWNGLSGMKVGVITQRTYILSQIPESAGVTVKESDKLVLEGLLRGEYDVAVLARRGHEALNLPDGAEPAGKVDTLSDYLYLHKKNGRLIPDITGALQNVFEDGRAEQILSDIPIGISRNKTVLHIISSDMEIAREERFNSRLRGAFKDDASIEWYSVSLNSRRFSEDQSRFTYFAHMLRQSCVSRDISAIVVSGADAFEFLKDHYLLFFRNVPVLYYGIDGHRSEIREDFGEYFTGIVESIPAYETVTKALELFPYTQTVYVVNDYTTEGQDYRNSIREQLEPLNGTIDIKYNENMDRDSLIEAIKTLPEDSIVLAGSYFCDSKGQYFSQSDMKRVLAENCSVPIFSVYSAVLGYNAVGGKCPDYERYGEVAADMLRSILDDGNGVAMPAVVDGSAYCRWVFDNNMMHRLGVRESSLPGGAQILNRTPSVWESNPKFAFSMVALFVISVAAFAIINLFFVRYRKQKQHLSTVEALLFKDEAIREVKERLERVINTAPVAFMMSRDDIVIDVNEYARENIGVKQGDNIRQFYSESDIRDDTLERISRHEAVANQILRLYMANGEQHRFFSNFSTVEYERQEAYIFWGADIEENETKKDQYRDSQKSLQKIMDSMPVPVGIMDIQSAQIVYGNKMYLQTLGVGSIEDLHGRNIREFVADIQKDGEDPADKINFLLDLSEQFTKEVQIASATGKVIDMRVLTCPIDYNGEKSALVVMTDLTAEKQFQQMLIHAAEKEKDANQLKSNFLVNMSHEIRTPMNAVIGLTEIELRKGPTKETEEIYKKINMSAKNLLRIINDILDLSKIEADKVELFNEEFELEDVLNNAVLVAAPRLDGKNVELLLNVSLDLPRFVIGDKTRLWQILKNFLDNSAKYTESGKIVLTAFCNNAMSDDETVYIMFLVEDTGIGMSEEQMQKLFMPYEQFYSEAHKRYTGTGLGMAISKQLCELMGGVVKAESGIGAGTSIYITIPFERSPNRETEFHAIRSQKLAGTNILAVDDDAVSLDIIARLLESSSINYEVARNGMEAMETILKYRDMGKSFDAILLDYMMDGLDGLETSRQIQSALSKAPKILLVTAYQKLLLTKEIEECGIDSVIEKPFIPSQFMYKLRETLGYEDAATEEEKTVTSFAGVKVLICEDYRLNQEVAVGMLEQFGVGAVIAEDGKQGIELLNSGERFDLIFMDLQMPVMDGYEATYAIRTDSRFDDIPIISLTADAMAEVVDKCLEAGMNDYIAKPVEFDRLHEILLKWLPESKRVGVDKAEMYGVDPLEQAIARFGGKKELYEYALLDFAGDLPEAWPDFEYVLGNREEIGREIHKIKGTSGNLGEMELYQSAVSFEASLRSDDPDKALYEQFVDACGNVKDKAAAQVKEASREDDERRAGTLEEFREIAKDLREALEDYNPKDSAEAVRGLRERDWPEMDADKLIQLCDLTLKYEFDEALDALDELTGATAVNE